MKDARGRSGGSTVSQRIKEWWPGSWGARVEQFLPAILAVLATKFFWLDFIPTDKRISIAHDLASPLVSVMAIGSGFIAASLTILTTANTSAIRKLRDVPAIFRKLIRYHACAAYMGVLACIVSLAVLGNKHFEGPPRSWIYTAWFLGTIWAGLTIVRVLVILVEYVRPKEP